MTYMKNLKKEYKNNKNNTKVGYRHGSREH